MKALTLALLLSLPVPKFTPPTQHEGKKEETK